MSLKQLVPQLVFVVNDMEFCALRYSQLNFKFLYIVALCMELLILFVYIRTFMICIIV